MPLAILIPVAAALFAIFPLTDTDIWWHLACGREWVTTWTPVRFPVVKAHEFFQGFVWNLYEIGGAPLLVAVKAFLWALVFTLFTWRFFSKKSEFLSNGWGALFSVVLLFIFRYQLEFRPVVFSLIFLGIYWNVLPLIFDASKKLKVKIPLAVFVLVLQWVWCRFQGLYILGPILVAVFFFDAVRKKTVFGKELACFIFWMVLLFAMPLFHKDGFNLWIYPFGLLDRLLGLSPSAASFASHVAENRSPFTLVLAGENFVASLMMLLFSLFSLVFGFRQCVLKKWDVHDTVLCVVSVMALAAERNFILLLPLVIFELQKANFPDLKISRRKTLVLMALLISFILGLWGRSLQVYDSRMVAEQRVPVAAAAWMKTHPHEGRLFNDDRAGGYISFVLPQDSIFIDGRFILKTSDFFERYLRYSEQPNLFLHDADAYGVDRALFPVRYYSRWKALLDALETSPEWQKAYVDSLYVIFDRILLH